MRKDKKTAVHGCEKNAREKVLQTRKSAKRKMMRHSRHQNRHIPVACGDTMAVFLQPVEDPTPKKVDLS